MSIRSALLPILLAAPFAAAAQSGSLWHYQFNQGVGEYSTGTWDSPAGGALAISCRGDGSVSIAAQIKGQAPPAGSHLRLTVSSRSGSRESSFPTDGQGSAVVASHGNPAFQKLWANLRAGDIVTLRYADDRTNVQSLAGAARTLPVKPCG